MKRRIEVLIDADFETDKQFEDVRKFAENACWEVARRSELIERMVQANEVVAP